MRDDRVRTYRREDLDESRRRWAAGGFVEAWRPYRELAAGRGFIQPPEGEATDSWDDDEPSQRAIVWHAIEDTPTLLRAAILRSYGWGQVVGILLREIGRLREDAELRERDASWERDHRPTRREAAESVHDVLERMR